MQKIKNSIVEQIYQIIFDRIVNVEIKPGSRINIEELAQEFNVSSTPVKEAIKKLSQEEFVDHVPRRGYYVIKLTTKKINEIYDLRKMYEVYSLSSAIKLIPQETLKNLKKEMENLREKRVIQKEDMNKFVKIDFFLHQEIIKNSNNATLEKLYNQIVDLIKLARHFSVVNKESIADQINLVEVMMSKNIKYAGKILSEHIDRAKENVLISMREKGN
jgi:DNA-binding GntR family transcriptional regulator